jgi:hypothetical protein
MHRANACRRSCQVRAMKLVRTKVNVTAKAAATRLRLASGLAMGSEPVSDLAP